MSKRTVRVEVELTIHEPEPDSMILFMLEGGGTWGTESLPYGCTGRELAAYLPDGAAVSLDVREILRAGMEALAPEAPPAPTPSLLVQMSRPGATLEYRALIPGRELAFVCTIVSEGRPGAGFYVQVNEAVGRHLHTLDRATAYVERAMVRAGVVSGAWTREVVR